MKLIRGFEINTNDLSALQESRSFRIKGDNNAVFSLQVKTSVGKFYNFKSKLFETTPTSEHRLTNQDIIGKSYSGEILFPADTDGETYTVLLRAEPHFETEISSDLTGTGTDGEALTFNPVLFQTSITQVADVTIYVSPIAATTANYTSATLAQRATITKSPTVTFPTTTTISWTIANDTDDGVAFGLIPIQALKRVKNDASLGSAIDIDNEAWYASTTAVIDDTRSDDGGGSTHYNYFVDSISDLSIGMIVTAISSGTLGSLPTLTRVNLSPDAIPIYKGKPQIKMNTAKAFADGVTLTLKGYSTSVINKALGCDITLSNFKLTQTPLTTTVRGTISNSTAIDVNGTYGISKGAFIEGFGVDNSTSNPIAAVPDVDEAGGRITSTVNQTLSAGTVLNIIGSSNSYTITGDITVNKIPTSSTTIYLDLDKLLTLGTAS